MTKIIEKEVICGFCNQKVNVKAMLSNHYHQVALDGNTKQQLQYQMIQVCPKCGHVALSLEKPVNKISSVNYNTGNHTIDLILKGAKTYQINDDFVLASYMYRLASWKAKEINNLKLWQTYYEKSIVCLEKYLQQLETITTSVLPYFLVLTDCYRQLGKFDAGKELALEVLDNLTAFQSSNLIDYLNKALKLELLYIKNKDTSEHYNTEVD